ncbi:MAG: acyl-CoA mutase large subunit family protein [Gammaproteobacteria bacterium]|nr:acyl-CoA mutase large subunit family protein [Gammaproteobacteria bacterium]
MSGAAHDRTTAPADDTARARWEEEIAAVPGAAAPRHNRSGIEVRPLYTPDDWDASAYDADLGYPGQPPFTRGIYPSMHRGRRWTQRQLIGLGTPADYNARLRTLLDAGATAISLIPCNSVYRGVDADTVDPLLLGTCGTVINTPQDFADALDGIPIERLSIGLNDPLPFTLLAQLLVEARRRGVPWRDLRGTSNQSDYLSHYVANHMFFRLALPGSRRVLSDAIDFLGREVPHWNPLSVVGQHMQQAGATPAQAMAFTLCTALQVAGDCIARGMDPDAFLPRFTFFYDISISFFEEIAKFRAGRRLWAKLARERLGARDPRSWRFKFHAQTSGVDLTRQQPLNNIARVTAQAIAGLFGGLQSLHTDAYDEVLSTPTEHAARIAIATQNILCEEAGLGDVIDPLGGSFYVESLTDRMEAEIEAVIAEIDAAGGMYAAVEQGLVQRMIGESAMAFQARVESGAQTIVGVNAYLAPDDPGERAPLERPDPERMAAHLERLGRYKAERSGTAVRDADDALARAADDPGANLFAAVVDATAAGLTQGEIVARLRERLGFGQPQAMV